MSLSKLHSSQYHKVFICGDTTRKLTKALSDSSVQEGTFFRGGIVHHKLKSQIANNLALYELLGPPSDYYCHGEVLGNLVSQLPALFIIVVRLKDGFDRAQEKLFHWEVFVENVCHRSKCKPAKSHFVLLIIKYTFTTKDSEISKIKTFGKTHFHMSPTEVLCTKSFKGKGFKNIKESVKMLVTNDLTGIMSMPNDLACRDVIHIDDIIDHNRPSSEREKLEEDLKGLTDRGLIFYTHPWIVLNQHSVSMHISSFLAEKGPLIASNTGLILVSELQSNQAFRGCYDAEMLVYFMKVFEFCHEADKNVVCSIQKKFPNEHFENILYFPALRNSKKVINKIGKGFGWHLWCPEYNEIFTTAFNEALFLQLVYTYAKHTTSTDVRLYKSKKLNMNISQSEECVYFQTEDQVYILMKIEPRSITLLVNCTKSRRDLDHQRMLSSIVSKILGMASEIQYSPKPHTYEYIIQPDKTELFPDKDISPYLYSIESIARGIIQSSLTITNGRNCYSLSSLLNLDPFFNLPHQVIYDIFNSRKKNRCVRKDTMEQIRNKLCPLIERFIECSRACMPTYGSVFNYFNQYSVFANRNPLELAGPQFSEDMSKALSDNYIEEPDADIITITEECKKMLDDQFRNLQPTPRGIAFVFGGRGPDGVETDVRNIRETFKEESALTIFDFSDYPTHDQLIALVRAASSYEYPKLRKFKFIAFYFAGHGGVNSSGEPYIVTTESASGSKHIKIAPSILQPFSKNQNHKTCLFFFDCCLSSADSTTDHSSLYALTAPPSCFVAFATNVGLKSKGGTVKGGLWTHHLCRNLKEKNFSLSAVMERTHEDVKESCVTQIPMFSSAVGDVHLHRDYRKHSRSSEDGTGMSLAKCAKVELSEDESVGNKRAQKRYRNGEDDDDDDDDAGRQQPAKKTSKKDPHILTMLQNSTTT